MIYNASKPIDCQNAIERFKQFLKKESVFELTEKRPVRSISQNSYLHLLFAWFALETGYTTKEVKQNLFKEIVNPATFYEGEFGELVKIERWRSTADLSTAEMTVCVDRFRDYSSREAGLYLPEPRELSLINEMTIAVANSKDLI
jgi:hypothetical protein